MLHFSGFVFISSSSTVDDLVLVLGSSGSVFLLPSTCLHLGTFFFGKAAGGAADCGLPC